MGGNEMKTDLNWKSTIRCEPQTLSDLQENTKEIRKLRNLIEDWIIRILAFVVIISLIFAFWALPVFIRLVNHLLSSN
jgi:hypothetical protein